MPGPERTRRPAPALEMTAEPVFTVPPGAVLALFNAALVSLAANGGYAAVERLKAGKEE